MSDYRYKHFTPRLLLNDLRFKRSAPKAGESFPDFDIRTTDGQQLRKRDFVGIKPLLLVTGSVTCPMTASAIPTLKRLYEEFSESVSFVMLNVREAHPGEHYPQPETNEEKMEHGKVLKGQFDTPWPVAIDDINGTLHQTLDGKPNAAFIMDSSGNVAFRAHWARDEGGLRKALASVSRGVAPPKPKSTAMFIPVARAMGHVQEVMGIAGPQAQWDLMFAATPMAVAGRLATLFRPLPRDWRGITAAVTLGFSTAAVIGVVAWLLT